MDNRLFLVDGIKVRNVDDAVNSKMCGAWAGRGLVIKRKCAMIQCFGDCGRQYLLDILYDSKYSEIVTRVQNDPIYSGRETVMI